MSLPPEAFSDQCFSPAQIYGY